MSSMRELWQNHSILFVPGKRAALSGTQVNRQSLCPVLGPGQPPRGFRMDNLWDHHRRAPLLPSPCAVDCPPRKKPSRSSSAAAARVRSSARRSAGRQVAGAADQEAGREVRPGSRRAEGPLARDRRRDPGPPHRARSRDQEPHRRGRHAGAAGRRPRGLPLIQHQALADHPAAGPACWARAAVTKLRIVQGPVKAPAAPRRRQALAASRPLDAAQERDLADSLLHPTSPRAGPEGRPAEAGPRRARDPLNGTSATSLD